MLQHPYNWSPRYAWLSGPQLKVLQQTGVSKLISFGLSITNVAIWLTECANFKVIITMTIVFHAL